MSKTVIKVENLTKDYGKKKGIFQINLEIQEGETVGFIGTNGSGKTTTIRHMMGFVKPDAGAVTILGKDSWKDATEIKKSVSYIPGEIAFPSLPTGTAFLKAQADMLGVKDYSYMNQLLRVLQLDPTANLKRMSKGMKQKTAIVAALMGNKEILILDEPTTGLDPLMRDAFLELMREEKKKGRTVFMSSQIMDEVEEICDKVAVIDCGHIIGFLDVKSYRHETVQKFLVRFSSLQEAQRFQEQWKTDVTTQENICNIHVQKERVGELMSVLKTFQVISLSEERRTLADAFKEIYMSR